MTGPKGNREFCFPETLNVRVEGKQNSLFHVGPVSKCFVIPPNAKIEQTKRLAAMTAKKFFLDADRHTNLPRF